MVKKVKTQARVARAAATAKTQPRYHFTRVAARGGASSTTATLNAATLRLTLPAARVKGFKSADVFYDATARVLKLVLSTESYGDGRLAIHASQHFVSLGSLRGILGGFARVWDIVDDAATSDDDAATSDDAKAAVLVLVARDFKAATSDDAAATSDDDAATSDDDAKASH